MLILFDCWINVFYYKPKISFIYTLGALALRQKWFPQIIADSYFGFLKKTKIYQKRAYKIFDQLLEESVLLNLKLEENIDFKYDDIDEIKSRNYKKRHLELMGYKKEYSSLEKNDMDYWNLHCFINHEIEGGKIKLCYLKNNIDIKSIFLYAIDNTTIDLEKICPILYGYLQYKKIR